MTPELEQFNKKRRNLVVTSVLVGFINIAGAELDQINLLGNEVTFSNPSVIPIVLAITLAYCLIRHIQYAHDVQSKGFQERFAVRIQQCLARSLLRREIRRKNPVLMEHIDIIRSDTIPMLSISKDQATAGLHLYGINMPMTIDLEGLKLSWRDHVPSWARAAAYVGFRTRLGTDYVLPYVLVALAGLTYLPVIQERAAAGF